MDDFFHHVEKLSAKKRELLVKRLSKPKARSRQEEIHDRPFISNKFPLSSNQKGLWFLSQYHSSYSAYHVNKALSLIGELNINALQKSIDALIKRHAMLRAFFFIENEEIYQGCQETLNVPMCLVDLQGLQPLQKSREKQRVIEEGVWSPFDLFNAPLFRVYLLCLSSEHYIFLLSIHHLIVDAWSINLFLEELVFLYNTYVQEQTLSLPELPLQYINFVYWQNEEQSEEKELNYWKRQLDGAQPLHCIPLDYPRPTVQTFRGAQHRFKLTGELTTALQNLGHQEGITLFMTLLAGLTLLLIRYSQENDVVIGTPATNRTSSKLEGIIGCFVNTLALRLNIPESSTVREVLAYVREVVLGAYSHASVPFKKLVKEFASGQTLNYAPIFQVMLLLQSNNQSHLSWNQIESKSLNIDAGVAQFDLTLIFEEVDGELYGLFEYNTDLFAASTIKRMATNLQILLTSMAEQPTQSFQMLPLLSKGEYAFLHTNLNTNRQDYPYPHCLHYLLENQVHQTPKAIALVCDERQITYEVLNTHANQLAHYLRCLGVGPEVRVGVCMERSVELVIGLLAILKAGGAYVPLDPDYPQERLTFMLQDAQVTVILTQTWIHNRLPAHDARVVALDSEYEEITSAHSEDLPCEVQPLNMAYIMYTSGSTGVPKGVINTHEAIYNRLLWMQHTYHLTSADRVLQKTPFSFDVSVWEFFWPLLVGASLIIAAPDGHRNPSYLTDLIFKQHITILHFVPSMLRIFLNEPDIEIMGRSLKHIFSSGETLPPELERRFFEHFALTKLHNLYGPTEAAIDVSYWQCKRDDAGEAIVPIGRPVANTQLYVLDKYLQLVPIGVEGELYIGGVQVARGYLNQPDLTAERFIPNPLGSLYGERLYRTGDRVRYRSDGVIEFLGRFDDQVKLRGVRIELGEIEATLVQHSSVYEAVVVVHEDTSGYSYLVAYIVPVSRQALVGEELSTYLHSYLPHYMVPTMFIPLEMLPLSPNGKLNRQLLTTLENVKHPVVETFVPPCTPAEEILARIWTEVLHVPQVGATSNFFTLGGDSIRAIQVISRAKSSGLTLSIQELFHYPTLRALARQLTISDIPVKLEPHTQAFSLMSPQDRERLDIASTLDAQVNMKGE